jgi:hypothetical protein
MKNIFDSKAASKKLKSLQIALGDIIWHTDPADKLPPKVKVAQFVNPGAQVIYDMFKYLKTIHMVMVMRYLNHSQGFFCRTNWDQLIDELMSMLISDAKFIAKVNHKKSLLEPIEKIRKLCRKQKGK